MTPNDTSAGGIQIHPDAAGADLGVEAVPAVQAHADERAHGLVRIVADVGTVAIT